MCSICVDDGVVCDDSAIAVIIWLMMGCLVSGEELLLRFLFG